MPERKPGSRGRAPSRPVADRPAVSVGELAGQLPDDAFQELRFRDDRDDDLPSLSRFAMVRVIAEHPVKRDGLAPREEWLTVERPDPDKPPIDYWISNLRADCDPEELARLARLRWTIELDYRQLNGHLGLDHYEGRSWARWHHHVAMVTLAHAFLTLERLDPKAPAAGLTLPQTILMLEIVRAAWSGHCRCCGHHVDLDDTIIAPPRQPTKHDYYSRHHHQQQHRRSCWS